MALAVLLLAVSRPFEAAPRRSGPLEGRRFATGTVSTYRRGHTATAWQAAAAAHWAETDGAGRSPSKKVLRFGSSYELQS